MNTFSSLLFALASDSAACALIHPSEQAKLIVDALLSDENIVHSPTTMSILQQEIPIIFNIIKSLGSLPPYVKLVVRQLWAIAQTPFDAKYDHSSSFSQPVPDNSEILSCFPSLPIVRERSAYVADALSRSKFFICTKKSSRHVSLLPGIFSLYCEHGNFCTEILHITCMYYRDMLWI